MKPSFVPLYSFAFQMIQSRGEEVPFLIHLPYMKPHEVEAYGLPPYDVSEMFIICGYVAKMLRGV